jgi:monofunctional glycosyltransferase
MPALPFAQLHAWNRLIFPRNRSKARPRRRTRLRTFAPVFGIFLAAIGAYQGVILFRVIRLRRRNPDITAFMDLRRQEVTSQGKVFRPQMVWVPYDSISPHLRSAIVTEEDPRFWRHPGFDPQAIWRAGKVDWKARRLLQGGSTLDQQLAKNLFFSPAKNPLRKVLEIIVAVEMETFLSKRRIIEIYLNVIEWGDGIYGVEAASQHYFGTSAASLNVEQAAYLTAIIPGPRGQYNPLEYPERVAIRANVIMKVLERDFH